MIAKEWTVLDGSSKMSQRTLLEPPDSGLFVPAPRQDLDDDMDNPSALRLLLILECLIFK